MRARTREHPVASSEIDRLGGVAVDVEVAEDRTFLLAWASAVPVSPPCPSPQLRTKGNGSDESQFNRLASRGTSVDAIVQTCEGSIRW